MSEAGEPRRAGSEPGPGGGQGDAALAVPKPGAGAYRQARGASRLTSCARWIPKYICR